MSATAIASTLDMDRNEWLNTRSKGLGGSDMGAVLGLNPYASPLDVYLDKIGEAPEQEDNDAMYWGRTLEDIVAQEYVNRTGRKVRRRNAVLQHPDHPELLANLDREIVGGGILECKTALYPDGWGDAGTDQVPNHYLIQTVHYMAITGAEYADLAVLIGGRDFRIYHIARDQELIDYVVHAGVEFWNEHVVPRVSPPPRTAEDMLKAFPRDNGASIQASIEMEAEIGALAALKEEIKGLEKQKLEHESAIKEELGDHSAFIDASGKPLVTWKGRKSSRFDTTTFRKDHPDLYKEYLNESTTRTFLVK